jgi:BirA family biotin operon repressor/biotin-[acetyl-CoA-carboxylase] ligase
MKLNHTKLSGNSSCQRNKKWQTVGYNGAMDQETLNAIAARHHLPACRYLPSTGSTNDDALRWLAEGAPEYAFVAADAQSAGRGRQGRRWISTPGASIALSIILRPTAAEQQRLSLFSLLAGLAAAQAISENCNAVVQVKWPNDVLIKRMKAAGILAEAHWENNTLKGLVIGIGINLLKASIPQDAELIYPATSLEDHSEDVPDAAKVIDALLRSLLALRQDLCDPTFPQQYRQKMAFLHEAVNLHTVSSQTVHGVARGIDDSGNLILQTDAGATQAFPVGEISLRPA